MYLKKTRIKSMVPVPWTVKSLWLMGELFTALALKVTFIESLCIISKTYCYDAILSEISYIPSLPF